MSVAVKYSKNSVDASSASPLHVAEALINASSFQLQEFQEFSSSSSSLLARRPSLRHITSSPPQELYRRTLFMHKAARLLQGVARQSVAGPSRSPRHTPRIEISRPHPQDSTARDSTVSYMMCWLYEHNLVMPTFNSVTADHRPHAPDFVDTRTYSRTRWTH